MRSAQRQVEIKRQNCKIIVCSLPVLPSPGRVGPGIKILRVIVARVKSV